MAEDPFLHELSALQQIDTDLVYQTGRLVFEVNNLGLTFLSQLATQATAFAQNFQVGQLVGKGRDYLTLYMALPILTTNADALMNLTGYQAHAAIAPTTTPPVIAVGKVRRIQAVTLTYVATATAGSAKFTLRANPAGVVALGSDAVISWVIGGPGATAGQVFCQTIPLPEGFDFPEGTGIGVSMVGLSPVQALAVAGYGQIGLVGYEYEAT